MSSFLSVSDDGIEWYASIKDRELDLEPIDCGCDIGFDSDGNLYYEICNINGTDVEFVQSGIKNFAVVRMLIIEFLVLGGLSYDEAVLQSGM